MQSSEIRSRFLAFFEKRGHAILPSASLVPENDPSVLFNTAGMQPLVPYLMGQKHPLGTRLASCQKCVRTGDLEDIGDNRHFSFFEMLGNWSLGDYFKEDAIKYSFDFLTNPIDAPEGDKGLGLSLDRLAVTIFEGDENAPYDQESKEIWMRLGIPEDRIYALPADDNWWSPGDNGPCGPCSEMFYDMQGDFVGKTISHDEFLQHVKDERFIEIWNDVFMEYEKKDGKVIGKLSQKNVDTGAGLERLTAVMQQKDTAYDTDILSKIMGFIKDISFNYNERSARIITDHIRTSLLMLSDGVFPSNKDRGYILRRLIRRAMIQAKNIQITTGQVLVIHQELKNIYQNIYQNIGTNESYEILKGEINKFEKTLDAGLKEFEKGVDPFILATTYGFPIELTEELAAEKGVTIDRAAFDAKMKEHQDLSRSGAEQKFKGGLANTNEATVKLHTAHHLLLAALQEVLGKQVKQKGSNITEERLRIDFNFDRKVTPEELEKVAALVNSWIAEKLPVTRREMKREDAEALGAEMEFGAKYPDIVSVYEIKSPPASSGQADFISLEFCGGPHVANTGDIGTFTIQKEEASSAGIRRIKATIA